MSLEFRTFTSNDCERCSELAAVVWPVVLSVTDDINARSFMKGYVELNEVLSNYTEVCCEQGKIAGFLFGCVGRLPKDNERRRRLRNIAWNYLSGKSGCRRRVRLILANVYSMAKTAFLCSRFDGEVLLFVVGPEYQGHGIGRALLNRFMEYSRSKGAGSICLTTDLESNWKFYERYGFKKYREYTDNGLSVFIRKRIRSFIYYYSLHTKDKNPSA